MDVIFNQLEPFLLRDVEFRQGGKVIKRGCLKLINTKQHFIKFTLEIDGELKSYELSYPFRVDNHSDGTCTMNYHISSFSGYNTDTYYKLKTISKQTASPCYDSEITLVSL